MDINIQHVIAGAFGALLPELIRIGKGPIDDIFKSRWYWVQLAAQLIAGALAGHYFNPKDAFAAFAFGYSLPQLMTRLAAMPQPTPPPPGPPAGGGPPVFNTRLWWAR